MVVAIDMLRGMTFCGVAGQSHPTSRLSCATARQVVNKPRFGSRILPLRQGNVLHFSRNPRKRVLEATSAGSDTEKQFKTTVELDMLIDTLRDSRDEKLPQVVAENILAFNRDFWLRLATRADLTKSADDKKEYEDLANAIMIIVQLIVEKTHEKIESSTSILKAILTPLIEPSGEISWPPRDPQRLSSMKKEVQQRLERGSLDESFLSEVSAQMRQARDDGDKPGLVAILQKVLQVYCSTVLSIRSYAVKGNEVDKGEELLEKLISGMLVNFLDTVISGEEENWNDLLRAGLVFGGGNVESAEFSRVVEKRVERTLMRTGNGSYQQKLLVEYLKEIQARAELLVEAYNTSIS